MIKKISEKLYHMIYGREYDLRERIFRMIVLVGSTLGVLGILECISLMNLNTIIIPLFILLAVLGIGLIATFKYHKIDFAAALVGFLIILLVFPTMFFLSGGLNGGATLWFALGLFYVFLMFSGKKLVFFLILSILADAFTYGYCYHHPEAIIPMNSRADAYLDSLFAVLAVGLAGGAILKVQMKMFSIERDIAIKQQKELEQISDSKNNFFASMSHEIRTPINTIIGLNEMILRESTEESPKEYALNIQSASKMLLNLVNDILDLSQMEMKKMTIIPMEYKTADLFIDLVDMIQVRLNEKNLTLNVNIDENLPSVLWGDLKRLNQVILNILTNAAKYTEKGSVTLSARGEFLSADEVQLKIIVEDTGIGIRKEDLQYLFDSFKRMDAKKNLRIEGSGLGLSITKHLIDLMDGEISVDSIYTKGSVFTIVLPQKVIDSTPIGTVRFLSRSRQAYEKYHQSFESPEAQILIVDDNPMNTMVACKLLEATKVNIDTAENGIKCLEMTKRKYYHIILMDYMMPEMNGLQTLRQLRKQENGLCKDSAVIVLSANSAAEAGMGLLEEGFDGYVEKPVHGAALEAEILKFLPEDIIEFCSKPNETFHETEIHNVPRQKKKKISITTDCVSDLPENLLEKYDIDMVYLYIKTESGRFLDTVEISSDSIIQYMTDSSQTPLVESITEEEYEAFFADKLTKAEQIIHISMAKNMGKSYENAVAAAESFDHVHIIDSTQISCGQGLVVLYAARLAMEGFRTKEICERIDDMKKRISSQFIMPSANVYSHQGLVKTFYAKLLCMLAIHPVLKMNQSKIMISGIRFGRLEDAWKRFLRWHFVRKSQINTDIIFISHVGCTVEQQEIIRREVLRLVPFQKVIMQKASVTTACGSGIGTFGFAYYKLEK